MGCIKQGKSEQEIVACFEGDEQLVNMWMMFLRGNRWIETDKHGNFVITEKAKRWMLDHPRKLE
jgi:predicted transcriptional regulator